MHHQSRLRSSFRGWCFQWRPVLTDCCGTAPFRPIACWKPASVRRCDRGTWRRRRRRKLLVPFFLPPPLLADTLWLRSPPVSTSATLHVSMPYTHTHTHSACLCTDTQSNLRLLFLRYCGESLGWCLFRQLFEILIQPSDIFAGRSG